MYSRYYPLLLLLVCFMFVDSPTTLAQTESEPLKIEDYFKLKSVSDPVISPDGKWVAYTVTETDYEEDESETRIWMSPVDGGDPLPMTAKGSSASSPQWSHDGKYLSFLASRGDDDPKTQVWVLDRRGGEAQQFTDIKQGVSGYEWSPDGSRLLLMIKDAEEESKRPQPHVIDRLQFKRDYVGYLDRRRTHIYTFTPGDTAAVQITSGDFDDSSPTWSPDGTQIAFVSNRTDNPDGNSNSDIWIVDADNTNKGEELIQVTTNPGGDYSPAWSPDGKHIAHISVIDTSVIWYATNDLALSEAKENGEMRVLTADLDRNISSPQFSDNDNKIWFELEDAGETQLASIKPNGQNLERVLSGDLTISGFDLHNQMIATRQGTFNQPDAIYIHKGDQKSKLTSVNEELLSQKELGEMEEIRFESEDGTMVEGFLLKPVGYESGERVPTILWLHGGPVAQYDHSFDFTPQLFAANGYAVLLINPRGSSGYGQDFSSILFADWGNKDFEDVIAGVDHAIEMGVADPEKLGVGGWSYGGILTNYVITKSDRFEGAISGASETLYRSNYGHDHYQLTWEKELGLPWETPEKWERISPFNDVDKVTTPTLWIGGAEDWNVPILGSEQMYQAMKRLGLETQLVVYPGEHHGIRTPTFQKDRFERFLGWFDTYVKGEKEE
ncbi:S9 family peptidase [Gracilimonas mengyeensis]|uniref:Dipeptidyl aminopeptidase/acylaminoacyl peptidase n=1 Tax=Gracilimonas mengyeensis TaxID=1302730 RepID=A0A521B8H6_9BACT|nr:S9 family peptidase [Gracilimonas mengyeensis]SMO43398.1 Dipeptidyl aminopeptidase/acylaminoacyl peptidase [Gracilimonas mengyeensis]